MEQEKQKLSFCRSYDNQPAMHPTGRGFLARWIMTVKLRPPPDLFLLNKPALCGIRTVTYVASVFIATITNMFIRMFRMFWTPVIQAVYLLVFWDIETNDYLWSKEIKSVSKDNRLQTLLPVRRNEFRVLSERRRERTSFYWVHKNIRKPNNLLQISPGKEIVLSTENYTVL